MKKALLLFLPLLLVVVFVSVTTFTYYFETSNFQLRESSRNRVKLAAGFISQNIESVIKDLKVLAQYSNIEGAFLGDKSNKDKLAKEFYVFSKEKKLYDQIRILDLNGQEIVRVDFNRGNPVILAENQLQNKASRYYFKESVKLERGQYFISRFDLNKEKGMVERPFKPTLRFSTSVYSASGEKIGFIVINYLGNKILDNFKKIISKSPDFPIFLDRSGNYLIGVDPSEEWGFMFGLKVVFPDKHPLIFHQMMTESTGQLESEESLFTYETVSFANERWIIIARSNSRTTISALINEYQNFVFIALCIVLILALAAWWYAGSRLSQSLLTQSKKKFNDFSNTSSDWLWETDVDGCFTEISRRMKEITGIDPIVYIGKPIDKLIKPVIDYPDDEDPLELINAKKDLKKAHFYVENFLEQILHFNVTAKPFYKDNVFHGYRGTSQDITNYKKLSKELQNRVVAAELAEAKADVANRTKSEFLANMSHEIRTPLSGTLGMAKIGLRETLEPESRIRFSHILDSGQHLLGVINDILDFSKIEAKKLIIETQPFQLMGLVEEAVNMVAERALDKGLKLSVNFDHNLPFWVNGDPLRLQQILLNLLSNAIKFTSDGEVIVLVSVNEDMILFTVSDSGIGLKEEQISRLFSPFEQADSSTTRKYGGTGLGLTISYNLAKLMCGGISVESQPGEGSVFLLNLPLPETNSPVINESMTREIVQAQLTGLHILVAEDVEMNRLIIEDLLEQEGASVEFAENGQLVIDLLEEIGVDKIDVVLMDIQMPVMDGYEATRRIHEIAPSLPVIGLTAHALAEEREKCLTAGMVEHITKPVSPEVLVTAIKNHVYSHSRVYNEIWPNE